MASHGAPEARGFQWQLRRRVVRVADFFDAGTTRKYPKTSRAFDMLRAAVEAEMRQRRKGVRVAPTTDQPPAKKPKFENTSRKHEAMARRLKSQVVALQARLDKQTVHQVGGKHISSAWLVKVFLTSASQNARGLTQAFRDVIGLDKNSVSRPTILKIRAAWVHHYKKMVMDLAAELVGGLITDATIKRLEFVVVLIRHVQDEADMRMRSGEDHCGMPSRSRASKVQQQVVDLFAGNERNVVQQPRAVHPLRR